MAKVVRSLEEKEATVKVIKEACIDSYMDNGYDIVSDNMNLNPKEVAWFENKIAEFNERCSDYNYTLEFKDFFISVDECIRRDSMRQNPIGARVIRDTWKRYRDTIVGIKIKEHLENELEQDETKPTAAVFDMDGTLCFNTSGRPFFGEGAAEGMISDIPNKNVVKIAKALKLTGVKIVILTGRTENENERNATRQWLDNHGIDADCVFMRHVGDMSHAVVSKTNIMRDEVLPRYNVMAVFEDNSKNVKAYRDMGLTVMQVNEGEF